MNWGWETDEYNAWFSFNNFNPNFFDFNDKIIKECFITLFLNL